MNSMKLKQHKQCLNSLFGMDARLFGKKQYAADEPNVFTMKFLNDLCLESPA